VVIHYEEALYQVYAPLRFTFYLFCHHIIASVVIEAHLSTRLQRQQRKHVL